MGEDKNKIGRYEILDKLGQGAMGIVYKAMDPNIGRIVALKTISQSANLPEEQKKEYADRFFREAKAAGSLQHPNIVTIYDMDEDDGTPFIAMEFIEGKSLAKLIEEKGKIPWKEAVDIIKQTAAGLSFAHEKGIVHRDIKPDNILIDRNGRAVVTDFGIAHLQESSLTRTGEVLGTPFFMSPEQILEGKLDSRSDLFSLGVVFYVMLTGRRPFRGETISSICYHIVHTPPDPLPADDSIPSHLLSILSKMLEKDPDRRYSGEKELIADLEKATAGLTVMQTEQTVDGPPPPPAPPQKKEPPKTGQQPPPPPVKKQPVPQAVVPPARKKSSAVPIIIIGGLIFVVFIFAVLGGGYYLYTKGVFSSKEKTEIDKPVIDEQKPPAQQEEEKPPAITEPPVKQQRQVSQEAAPPVPKPKKQEEQPKEEAKLVEPPPPPPPIAETKPALKPSKIGMVFETKMREISLAFYIDGEEKLREVFTNESGTRYGQEFKVQPGQHQVRVVVQATKFPPFIREGTFTIDVPEGSNQILKIEPARKPTPSLVVKRIDSQTGQSTVIMEK
jgi:eukaryotic-like serine/threonine-protein kinase